jgi:hypothetical protein
MPDMFFPRRYTRGELKAYDEQVAEAIVCAGLKELGLAHSALADLPKNAPAKALLAHIITEQTSGCKNGSRKPFTWAVPPMSANWPRK